MKLNKFFLLIITISLVAFASPSQATYGVQTKTSHCLSNQVLPDSNCTPGAILTTDTSVICVSGYTKKVRSVSLKVRKRVFAQYGIPYIQHSNYEVDHLISLELGGSNSIANLWPENSKIDNGSLTKDKFENYLHKLICSGQMTIAEAQKEISSNWLQYYPAATVKSKKVAPASPKVQKPIITPVPQQSDNLVPLTTPALNNNSSSIQQSSPQGATAKCKDGTYSFAATHTGACSHHGGVAAWY